MVTRKHYAPSGERAAAETDAVRAALAMPDCTLLDRAILGVVVQFRNKDWFEESQEFVAWTSAPHLARIVGAKPEGAEKARRRLIKRGILKVIRRTSTSLFVRFEADWIRVGVEAWNAASPKYHTKETSAQRRHDPPPRTGHDATKPVTAGARERLNGAAPPLTRLQGRRDPPAGAGLTRLQGRVMTRLQGRPKLPTLNSEGNSPLNPQARGDMSDDIQGEGWERPRRTRSRDNTEDAYDLVFDDAALTEYAGVAERRFKFPKPTQAGTGPRFLMLHHWKLPYDAETKIRAIRDYTPTSKRKGTPPLPTADQIARECKRIVGARAAEPAPGDEEERIAAVLHTFRLSMPKRSTPMSKIPPEVMQITNTYLALCGEHTHEKLMATARVLRDRFAETDVPPTEADWRQVLAEQS